MKRIKMPVLAVLVAVAVMSAHGQPTPTEAGVEETPSAGSPTIPADISPGVSQVIKLAEGGSSDDVILAYVQNSEYPFKLTGDVVIYLKDLGLSSPVVSAMLTHDASLHNQPQKYVYEQKLYAPATPPPGPPPSFAPPAPEQSAAAPPQQMPEQPQEAPPVVVGSPPPQVNYFYDDLSPYGTWVEVEGVGWCWQPSTLAVNRAWRPYCDGGHWEDSDNGWYWQSDYSWGWAPFHYGRWYRHERCGWVWVPDTVWAPAWVTWRAAGDRCGWAPLPPHADFDARIGFRFNGVAVRADFDFGLLPDHFTFIAMRDFGEHDLRRHCLGGTEVNVVFRETTVINNFAVVNNTVIVNRGIPIERIRAVSHAEFRHLAIRDLPAGGGRPAEARGQAVAYRHELREPAHPEHMVAQRVDAAHPVVQHAEVRSLAVERKPLVRPGVPAAAVAHPGGGSFEAGHPGTPAPARTLGPHPEGFKQPAAPATPKPPTGQESRQPTWSNTPKPVTAHPAENSPTAKPTLAPRPTPNSLGTEAPKPANLHPTEVTPPTQPQVNARPDSGTHAVAAPSSAVSNPNTFKGNNSVNFNRMTPPPHPAQPSVASPPPPATKQPDNGQSDKKKNGS